MIPLPNFLKIQLLLHKRSTVSQWYIHFLGPNDTRWLSGDSPQQCDGHNRKVIKIHWEHHSKVKRFFGSQFFKESCWGANFHCLRIVACLSLWVSLDSYEDSWQFNLTSVSLSYTSSINVCLCFLFGLVVH